MTFNGLFVGLTTVDIQYFVDKFPNSNVKIKIEEPDILVGGPAANASVAFSFLNNGTNLVTQIGENAFSSFVFTDFEDTNVSVWDLAAGQIIKPVIASVITSSNGDRNIFTHNPKPMVSCLDPQKLFDKIKPEIVLLDGFYPDFSAEVAKIARKNNIPVVLDCGGWKVQYKDLFNYADIAICSADFMPPNCKNVGDVFSFLKNAGVEHVAISRGEKSILYEKTGYSSEIKVPAVEVVDTLGAGDFLHGAFCYFYLQTGNFINALKKAANFASHTCSYGGTREWMKNDLIFKD